MDLRVEIFPGNVAWPLASPVMQEVWPPEAMATVSWRGLVFAHADKRVLTFDADGRVICHVGVFLRDMTWNGQRFRVGGIGGVATAVAHRRRGIASAALRRAAITFGDDGLDFGLLFCEPEKFNFYSGLGWHQFNGSVQMEQPSGQRPLDVVTGFVLDLKQSPRSGAFDLCGLPW